MVYKLEDNCYGIWLDHNACNDDLLFVFSLKLENIWLICLEGDDGYYFNKCVDNRTLAGLLDTWSLENVDME